jgi:hypothetical protein
MSVFRADRWDPVKGNYNYIIIKKQDKTIVMMYNTNIYPLFSPENIKITKKY